MEKNKIYDLEERTYLFARNCRLRIFKLLKTLSTIDKGKTFVRSSGSIAGNYIG